MAEVLLARKSGVSYMQLREDEKEILQIDGHRCVIVWNHHTQDGRERYRIHIDAPRFLPIHRTECFSLLNCLHRRFKCSRNPQGQNQRIERKPTRVANEKKARAVS